MATEGGGPPSILPFPLYTGVWGIAQQTDLFAVNAAHIPGIAKAVRPEQIRLSLFRDRRASSNCCHGCLRFQGVPLKNTTVAMFCDCPLMIGDNTDNLRQRSHPFTHLPFSPPRLCALRVSASINNPPTVAG